MANHRQDITEIEDLHQLGKTQELREVIDRLKELINLGDTIVLERRPVNASPEIVRVLKSVADLNVYQARILDIEPELKFTHQGVSYKGILTIKTKVNQEVYGFSVLIDASRKSFVEFSYEFIGLKHKLTQVNQSDNYDPGMTTAIENALLNLPGFPLYKS